MQAALLLAAAEELSTIAVPIRATLAPLLPQIEAKVPAEVNVADRRE